MCTGYYGSGMGPMSDVPSFISKFVCMCRFCRKTRLSLSLFSSISSPLPPTGGSPSEVSRGRVLASLMCFG